jgi:rubrerythrin
MEMKSDRARLLGGWPEVPAKFCPVCEQTWQPKSRAPGQKCPFCKAKKEGRTDEGSPGSLFD